jgi:TRAP-type mannitol/chloroaromatic compound transport system substrate-binding protein
MLSSLILGACASTTEQTTTEEPTVVEWRAQHYEIKGNSYFNETLDYLVDRVKELSGGRFVITPYGGGEIVGPWETGEAVSNGVLDMGVWAGMFDTGTYGPAGDALCGYPFCFPTGTDWAAWYYNYGGAAFFQEYYEPHNMHVVGLYVSGTSIPMQSTVPLPDIETMKTYKIRASAMTGDVLGRLGVNITMIEGGELYTALQLGLIDGARYGSPAENWGLGLQEVAKNIQTPGWDLPSCAGIFVVNKASWDALPADLQTVLEIAGRATWANYELFQLSESAKLWKQYYDIGCQVTRLPDSDLASLYDTSQQLLDEVAASDPLFAEILQSQRDFQAEVDKLQSELSDISFVRP